MQRPTYSSVPPAHSPPLHHPVPQHISQVPNMRSPPPPAPQSAGPQGQNYGYGGSSFTTPGFSNFINEGTAQMGAQMAEQYMEKQFSRIDVSAYKNLFNVSNAYVINKLILCLFPWRHRPWSRKQASYDGSSGGFLPPREDINSPDMYIPVMGCVTYVLLSALLAGLRGAFDPALLSTILMQCFIVIGVEIALLRLAKYFLNIGGEASLPDLVSYAGYKFVGINLSIIFSELWNRGGGTGGFFGWTIFLYCYSANAFLLLRSLRYVLLPDTSGNAPSSGNFTHGRKSNTRNMVLAAYSLGIQLFFMFILTRNV